MKRKMIKKKITKKQFRNDELNLIRNNRMERSRKKEESSERRKLKERRRRKKKQLKYEKIIVILLFYQKKLIWKAEISEGIKLGRKKEKKWEFRAEKQRLVDILTETS